MLLTAKDRMRELRLWSKIKAELKEADPNFDDQNVNTHQQKALPIRLAETIKFFEKANDPDGAKNIASQLVTAERLMKEGKIPSLIKKDQIKNDKTNIIPIPACGHYITPLVYVIPMQLLSYYVAINKKTNIDQPRNLAKSVTVE